ncbi:9820_t:CDS:1, partial [Dentiscutata erythropus]
MSNSDSIANNDTSNNKYDTADNNSSSNLQFFIFKHNNHKETRINNMIDYENLFIIEEQDYIIDYAMDSENKKSVKSTYKQSEKSR